ncbi:acetolactate synthase [Marinobacter sp. NP-4(2019)]|uniref:ACT domain-containing protein n=1 Tax=Marinobacter sp. NP-4(2019) TaxID=2488665 RepID=UPI000FC3EB90|nr:ACT domain-containing protein [Marinobacter sp. NP-4(2019)]AZT83297.1 acetolactate synthase [Marinobacter sp. NP-4(2019)]
MTPQADTSIPSYTLNCRMTREAAALERLCQVIRIRGFRIARMAVESSGEHLDIALTLEGARPIAMLQSQLEKLHTVVDVYHEQVSLVRSRMA